MTDCAYPRAGGRPSLCKGDAQTGQGFAHGVLSLPQDDGGVVCSCKNVRTSKSCMQAKIEVKGKAHNHKTHALCALRHVVVMGFNTSILACM